MKTWILIVTFTLSAFSPLHTLEAQITNPVLESIEKLGLTVRIQDVARLPHTGNLRPADQDRDPKTWARVSFVHDVSDGRRFANDSRGQLYL